VKHFAEGDHPRAAEIALEERERRGPIRI
jgi:hypothetical protein